MATQRIGWAGCPDCGGRYRLRHTCDPARVALIAERRAAAAAERDTQPIANELDTLVADAPARIAQLREIVTRNLSRTITQLPEPTAYLRANDGR